MDPTIRLRKNGMDWSKRFWIELVEEKRIYQLKPIVNFFKKADLAICDLTITYERRTAVDFTMPFMTLGISILYAKPKKEPPGLFSFMSPLSLDVWLYVATAYLCVSVLLFFLGKYVRKSECKAFNDMYIMRI